MITGAALMEGRALDAQPAPLRNCRGPSTTGTPGTVFAVGKQVQTFADVGNQSC